MGSALEAADYKLLSGNDEGIPSTLKTGNYKETIIALAFGDDSVLVVQTSPSPLRLDLYRSGVLQVFQMLI